MIPGWLGGLTKTSDRYVRWFGTLVPMVSRGFIVILTLIGALAFSIIIYLLSGLMTITANLWIVTLLAIATGALLHIFYLSLLTTRFSNFGTSTEFQNIVSRVHQRIVVPSRTHVWTRPSSEVFIATTFNPLFNAVIISEPMVERILQSPESGEALLAFHLMRVPRTKWVADLIGSVCIFLFITFITTWLFIPLFASLLNSIMYGYYFIIILAQLSTPIVMGSFLFILIVKGAFWKHEPAFGAVQEIYGIHPNVAKLEVEQETKMNEEEAQAVVWSVRDWEKKKRGARRIGVSTLIASALFLPLYAIFIGMYYPFYLYNYGLLYLPFIVAAIAFLVSYLLLRHWDKNAMGEVFKKTTDYDEPIWMD